MARKSQKPEQEQTPAAPAPEERVVLSRSSAWDAAKAEFLDPSRPKPRFSVLAMKYEIDVASLMRASINGDWEKLRNQAETQAIIQVTPEARAGVLQQLDTIIVGSMREAAQEAGAAYVDAIRRVRNMEIAEDDEDDDEPKRRKGKPKKYSLSQQANLLNTLTTGISDFAKAVKELGWSLNPNTEPGKGGDVLKNAINVTAVPPTDTPPPPPITQPGDAKIKVNVEPPPPPPPPAT